MIRTLKMDSCRSTELATKLLLILVTLRFASGMSDVDIAPIALNRNVSLPEVEVHEMELDQMLAHYLESTNETIDSNNVDEVRLTTTSLSDHRRRKRAVFNLGSMVDCVTSCHPLTYAGYGCFCGYLGSGRVVDGIDRCCYEHDWCYSDVSCPSILIYFMPYYWKCNRGRPLCLSRGVFGWKSKCGRQLCECDRRFALCLRRYRCPRSRRICRSSKISMILNNFLMLGR